MTLLEAIDSLIKDKVDQIKSQNVFINLLGTVGGAIAGGFLGAEHDLPLLGTTLGSMSGSALSSAATMNREDNYINQLICGPYADDIADLTKTIIETISNICDLHRDYAYTSKLMVTTNKFENCMQKYDLTESNIMPIRKCILNNLSSLLTVIHNYSNEKRANRSIINLYKNELIPRFRTIEHYLLNAKVKV